MARQPGCSSEHDLDRFARIPDQLMSEAQEHGGMLAEQRLARHDVVHGLSMHWVAR